MSNVVHFPLADRREQVKAEKQNELDIYDHLALMVDECGVGIKEALKPENLAILCKVLMEDARRAKEKGRTDDFNYFDDMAWQVRSKNDAVTDILYAEGFLQKHGIF